MAESDESLLKAINHYQNGLERYMQRQDETKMLHNLGRLYKLPIKVSHLERTGVGRTVNSLRKLDGEVGDAAKSLVAKWKEMVLQEEDRKAGDCPSQDESPDVPEDREELQDASHVNKNNHRKNNSDKYSKKSSSERRHHSSKSRSSNENSFNEKKHKEKIEKRSHSSSEDSTDDHDESKKTESDNSEDMKRIKNNREKERKSIVNSKDNHKNSRESKNKLKNSSGDDESEHESHKTKKESKHESHDKKKHRSSHERKEEISKNKSKDEKKHDSSKHDKDKKKEHKEKESKEKKVEKHDKHKKSKHDDKIQKGESSQLQGSSSSSKNEKNEKNKSLKSSSYTAVINGIGSESGTSFADALGMCGPPPSKKKKLSLPERTKEPSPVLDEEEENELPAGVLPMPKEPLENLDINISSLLPPITPHYRPLGLPVDDLPKKMLTDDEALSRVMMNKNQRTKVYSGNKVAWGKVPSLFDICVRILQDNIDALEYTGGVPYSILKPILEKATANQLYMMEHHNPYLIDDSDELWKLHCQTEFRNKRKEEMESWRDMYMRCLDEREAKLRALTANIKQSQDKSLPVRTTKLAYVDSVAKPPRNIARKQAKNDTNTVRPSAKLATLATKGEAGKVSVPNPGSRAAERSSSGSSHAVKAKKAPLMAKTLSLFKNRFRR